MRAPDLTAADYAEALSQLLPPGIVWPARDSALRDVIDGLAPTAGRVHARAAALLDEAFPATTLELLPEWEASLSLPDECGDPAAQTIQERRAAVVARLVARGGQSIPYFIEVAAALGFTITIEEFQPFALGRVTFGKPLLDVEAAYRWRVIAPEITPIFFRFGSSAFGEPFVRASNAVLECVLDRIKPAHTTLEFQYGS